MGKVKEIAIPGSISITVRSLNFRFRLITVKSTPLLPTFKLKFPKTINTRQFYCKNMFVENYFNINELIVC